MRNDPQRLAAMPLTRVLLFVVCFIAGGLQAAELLRIEPGMGEYEVGRSIDFIEDKDSSLTIDTVQSPDLAGRWIASREVVPNFGFTLEIFHR